MARRLEARLEQSIKKTEQAAKLMADAKKETARLRALQQAEVGKEKRKLDNKRKILLGAYMLDRMEREDGFQAKVMPRLDKFLVRPADRAIFGLPPMPTSPPPDSSDAA